MTPFRTLLNPVPGLTPGEAQERARQLLKGRIELSVFRWWTRGQSIPADRQFMMLGVAVWSGYDLNLLDHLVSKMAQNSHLEMPVYVFDADCMASNEELEALLPGIGFVNHTPYVGLWKNGELIAKASGFHGRQLVARWFHIPESLVNERIVAAS